MLQCSNSYYYELKYIFTIIGVYQNVNKFMLEDKIRTTESKNKMLGLKFGTLIIRYKS